MEWLFRSEFDVAATAALWSLAAVVVTTIVLFVYTMGLRWATLTSARRRRLFLERWRDIFVTSVLSEQAALSTALPPIRQRDNIDLLEEWNRARTIVAGGAAENLIKLAMRTGIPRLAHDMLERRRMRSRILAAQTLGHLRDRTAIERIQNVVDHENTALSITAATALVEIAPDRGVAVVVPLIEKRRDWPRNRVSILLRHAGSERISEPMYRAIRSADAAGQTYLLQFAQLIEAEVLDGLVEDLLRHSSDPGVLNAALKLVSGFGGVPRIAWLTQHPTWYVRMQAAKVLGRIGQKEHVALLEALLIDPEWWVRYRAAQAIVSLPFLGPNRLRWIQRRQTDRFAADILQQTFAEVGIA